MGRTPCCSKEGMNRGAWTALEDQILTDYIKTYGEGRWRNIPEKAGLKRCGKSCRLRWLNYLRPDIKRGNITNEEEDLIIRLHKLLGNRWSLIAGRLPGRTDNEIKNYWNTTLGKKVRGEQPKQSKEVKKKTNIKSLPLTMVESSAIRTKSLRCTKVSVNQQPPKDENNVEVELKSSGEALSITTEENNSQDFPMDFDIGQLFLPDISDSEFWKLCQFDNRWPSLDQPLLSSEDMLKDC